MFAESRGELFKWASHDDLYGRDLLRGCVEALDERPEVILAHTGQAVIDGDGKVKVPYEYTSPPTRRTRRSASAACCSSPAATTSTG